MKNIFLSNYLLIVIITLVITTVSCSKDDNENNPINGNSTAVFKPGLPYGSVTDQCGNVYKTITIGTQTWMAQNLRTTKYNDGSEILNVPETSKWTSISTGAYCSYNDSNSLDTITTYGYLYNARAVNTGKLAPKGWHVPTDEEWSILMSYLGNRTIAGAMLKEEGTVHWTNPNDANNNTGFTALPRGLRDELGTFTGMRIWAFFWSSTPNNSTYNWGRYMIYGIPDVYVDFFNVKMGMSVRCIKD